MANSAEFIAHVLELMRPAGPVSARAMFGGHGIYAGGPIVALVIDDVLYFKTDDVNRGEFAALALEPFVYTSKAGAKTTTSYRRAPDDALESAQAMGKWLRSAQGAALRGSSGTSPRVRKRSNAPMRRP